MQHKLGLKLRTITWGTLTFLITTTITLIIISTWWAAIVIGSLSALEETLFYCLNEKTSPQQNVHGRK